MMWLWHELVQPFVEFGFMRRALAGSWALSLAAGPLGVILVLRRLSLMGDAMAHAILPGVAVGFLTAGFSLTAMTLGGLLTGIIVAILAGLVSRITPLREDASFAAFYLVSLGLGVMLVSLRGTSADLMHVLFGTVLGLDDTALLLVTAVSSLTLLALAGLYRVLLLECLDPLFLQAEGGRAGFWAHMAFLLLLVLNLVAGFQVLGTLMVVGIMMLPATAARFWVHALGAQMVLAAILGALSSWAGLLLSYWLDVAASPAIILVAGLLALVSMAVGPRGGLWWAWRQQRRKMAHEAQGWLLPWVLVAGCLLTIGTPVWAGASPAVVPVSTDAERVPVVATFSILGDMVRQVGGQWVDVHTIVGPLAEVHDHEPVPQDLQALGQARLLVSNGLGLETWLAALRAASGFSGVEVVASHGVAPRFLGTDHSLPDPHAWLDPAQGVHYLHNIAQGLSRIDPDHAAQYQSRAQQLADTLTASNARWQARLAQVPPDARVLATAHDAFGYLARAWDLRILPLSGVGGHAEPSARGMADWMRTLRADAVRALFLEQGAPSHVLRQISRETGVPLAGPLFADTLDAPGQPAGTYLGLLTHNAEQLLQVLTSPETRDGASSGILR